MKKEENQFRKLIKSDVWKQEPDIRVVWVTLLGLAREDGLVKEAAPEIAEIAGLPLPTVLRILTDLPTIRVIGEGYRLEYGSEHNVTYN